MYTISTYCIIQKCSRSFDFAHSYVSVSTSLSFGLRQSHGICYWVDKFTKNDALIVYTLRSKLKVHSCLINIIHISFTNIYQKAHLVILFQNLSNYSRYAILRNIATHKYLWESKLGRMRKQDAERFQDTYYWLVATCGKTF